MMDRVSDTDTNAWGTARVALVVLWVVALIGAVSLLPSHFTATQADWQVNEVARSIGGISYETLVALAAATRLFIIGLYLATAGFLLTYRPRAITILAALAMTTMPFTFALSGAAAAAEYPQPVASMLSGLTQALSFAGLASLLLLLFLFPDGRFFPARLWIPGLIGVAVAVIGMIALQFIDAAWGVFFVALLIVILLGVAGQVWRYRMAGPEQRRQTIVFLIANAGLLVWLLLSFGGFSALLSLVAGYIVLVLLALGIAAAALRGVWGEGTTSSRRRVFTGALVLIMAVSGVAAVRWWRDNQPVLIDVSALVTSDRVPVLFDTDMAMDDVAALFFLLQHPGVDVRAITVNGVAFAHCDAGVRNALGLLEVARAPEIPVACGWEEAYPGGRPAPDDWRTSADKLHGGQVRTGNRHPDPRPAARLLADTIAAAPGEMIVVAVGPLTNLAEAFEADPSLAGQIKEIVIMGGALDAPGNVSDGDSANKVAEWNFFADPVAADIVLASGAPITLVPLDATNDVPFRRGFYERLRTNLDSRPATFIYNLLYMNQWWLDGGMYWWDTLAAAVTTDPDLVVTEEVALDVVTDAGPEMGRSIESPNGSPVRVATAADARRFESLFLAVLNHE